ncbi:MAG: PucR family transcriptional regulator ligand-binding domain-containing protein [bacterium]|nr:PucR family transcriptional regulator ligand-binding domain-containing protein [bacterium]
MALTLNEILVTSKSKYRLTQLCGENGLNNVVSWVYISEDISTASFLKGGELIITTGVSCRTPTWLYDFTKTVIEQGTCGLILNIGTYIKEEDITEDLISLCEAHSFPLFTMPWETHIYDITRDYYNRILIDSQTDTVITNAFLSVIRNTEALAQVVEVLEQYNYTVTGSYSACVVNYTADASFLTPSSEELHPKIQALMKRFVKRNHLNCHIILYKNDFLLIFHDEELSSLTKYMEQLLDALSSAFEGVNFHIGIGSMVDDLTKLSTSYQRGMAALSMSHFHDKQLYRYDDMGFLKILLSANDKELLTNYMNDHLKKIMDYDAIHNTEYLETLHNYLLHNGSIQLIAGAMFCHRNTVNYRIHVIKDVLDFDLDSTDVRFNLMVSFAIKEYLEVLA